jgi:peptide/nickel transport system substrate-binding protein
VLDVQADESSLPKEELSMSTLKELEKLLTQGKITRREFIARVSALGLMAAVSPALLGTAAEAAGPKRGGRFKLGSAGGSTTDSMDPGTLSHTMPQTVNQCLRSMLVEVDYKGNAVPELAESWEASPDAAKWTFKLRKGVEFHNGKTMDAEDVIYSFNLHRGETKSAAKGVAEPIKDIKADGKNTVIFTLAEGNADFPYIASDYHIPIVPKGVSGKEFEKGVGTGPFIMQAWEPGVRFLGKRNPNYFREGRPYFDEVEIIGIADTNARTNALMTGQVHLINRCEPKTFNRLEKAPQIQALKLEGARHYTIPMLTTMKPYDNNDVRLGLKYVIDREQMIKQVLRGYGYLGNDHPIPRNNKYFAKDLPQRRYDPDKAKFHLNYWSGRPTADWMFSLAYTATANWNDTKWQHAKFNELVTAARAELDDKKRLELYAECQKIVSDEGATPIPAFALQLSAAGKKCGFKNPAANWEFDGFRAPERWWFV